MVRICRNVSFVADGLRVIDLLGKTVDRLSSFSCIQVNFYDLSLDVAVLRWVHYPDYQSAFSFNHHRECPAPRDTPRTDIRRNNRLLSSHKSIFEIV